MSGRGRGRPRGGAGGSRGILGLLFDGIFPPACVICGRGAGPGPVPACDLCWHRLPRVLPPRCRRCGATRILDLPSPATCPECDGWSDLPAARAPYRMEGGALQVVHAFKYRGAFALADRMAEPMVREARRLAARAPHGDGESRSSPSRVPVLVPVPLARARRRERGYNQAALLARALGRRTGWPVRRLLVRNPGGGRQARLGRRDRRRNVRGRFQLREGAVRGSRGPAMMVDDVLTTGATAESCAGVLRGAGAPVLGVVTFARALQRLEDS